MKVETTVNRTTKRVTCVKLTAETFIDEQFLGSIKAVHEDKEGDILVFQNKRQIGGVEIRPWEKPGA